MTNVVQQIINKYQGSAPQRIINAVENAARQTGADFAGLMQKASSESGFDPSAKAKTSSATGLFQFIDSTWLNLVKEHGAKYGLGHLAEKIEMKNGRPCVNDCEAKKEILNLRKNPEISALMAGEMAADDKQYLQAHTKGKVGGTEMYLAHFLGAGDAAKFLNAQDKNGAASAARLFPEEARANKSIFYTANGQARSLDQVYNLFAKKVNTAHTQLAQNTPSSKFNNGSAPEPSPAASATTTPAPSAALTPSTGGMTLMPQLMAQAFSSSETNDLMWYAPASSMTAAHGGFSSHAMTAERMYALAQSHQMKVLAGDKSENENGYFA